MNPPTFRAAIAAIHMFVLPASAAVVDATYNSQSDVPVTAVGYTAAGNTVDFTLNFAPAVATCLMVVKNTGTDFIQGAFDNLAQGQTVNLTYGDVSYPFVANYHGGSGNDLVLEWANNRLLAWGYNNSGQLGNNSTTNSGIAVPVDMSGVLAGKTVVRTAAGLYSVALCSDGSLAAWGYNYNHELGNESSANSSVPLRVNLSGSLARKTVVDIAVGLSHTLALCADGSVIAWGSNSSGQLGCGAAGGTTTTWSLPVLVDMTGVLAGKTVVAVAAGSYHNLALCADGTLTTWGSNGYGQLGNNSTTSTSTPVLVNRAGVLAGKTITAIAAGGNHSLALCSDGTLATWGYNNSGQLGNNSTSNSSAPVLVVISGELAGKTLTGIAAGNSHSLALCTDGSMAAWGYNASGQLGNGITGTNSYVPVLVNQTGVLAGKSVNAIGAGYEHNLAQCNDGSLVSWGTNGLGTLGNNSTSSSSVPVAVTTTMLRTGERLLRAGSGNNSWHNLAVVAMHPLPAATTVAATAVTDTGATLNASVNAQGTTTTVSFEYGPTNSYGSTVAATPTTATGTTATAARATLGGLPSGSTWHYRVVATSMFGTTKGADMSFTTPAEARLTGLLVSAGTLYPAFASINTHYVLAVPYVTDNIAFTPSCPNPNAVVTVNGVTVASGIASAPVSLTVGNTVINTVVTAADSNTQAYIITVTRLPQTITYNSAATTPVTVGDFVASGNAPNIILNYAPAVGSTLSVVKNTGLNPIQGTFSNLTQGQVVNLTFGGVSYPFVANYYGGTGNDLVLQWGNNRLLAWGYNYYGQLGNNTSDSSNIPTAVDVSGVLAGKSIISISTGRSHALALCADGSVASWGSNSNDQLGISRTSYHYAPGWVDRSGVLASKTVIAIAAGNYHNLALCSDGTLASWGDNTSGQLGNDTNTSSGVPVLVDRTGVLSGKTIIAIAAGFLDSFALCSDGTLAGWGNNNNGCLGNNTNNYSCAPVRVCQGGALAGKTILADCTIGSSNLALTADGILATWGSNSNGELGNKTTISSGVPVPVDKSGVLAGKTISQIIPGGAHFLVLCSDGKVVSWGLNNCGQLGNNTTTNSSVPVAVLQTGVLSGKTVTAISAGNNQSYALCSDNSLAAWGYNSSGELGNNSTTNSSVPVTVNRSALAAGEIISAVTGGDGFSLALVASPPAPVSTSLAAMQPVRG